MDDFEQLRLEQESERAAKKAAMCKDLSERLNNRCRKGDASKLKHSLDAFEEHCEANLLKELDL
jgi:hypothetical protein